MRNSGFANKMNRNSGELTLQETDTTDCSCMQLYNRNNKHNQTTRSSTLRSHQSHPRVNTCAKCRKRKPGNPKNPQHCPSCLCPPDVVRSSSGRLRGAENMEEVLSRFEEITRDPRENEVLHKSVHNTRGSLANGKNMPIRSSPKKSSINASRQQQQQQQQQQQHKSEHDQVLNALYQDLMSSGLAGEEAQGCRRYQLQHGPIKSVRRKSNFRPEQSPSPSRVCNQESVDLDSDAVLRYFRDYKNLKNPTSDILLNQKEDIHRNVDDQELRADSRQQENIEHSESTSKILDGNDQEKRQFERDKRELKELSKEVRDFEMNKGRDREENDEVRWDKLGKKLPSEDGDQSKRRVSFLPSKLPVPMFTGVSLQSTRSRSPAADGDQMDKVIENKSGRNSTSILDINAHEECDQSLDRHLDYSKKESRNSSSQDFKDIPYCHNAPYRSLSSPMTHASKTEEQTEVSEAQRINGSQDQCTGLLPTSGLSKKYICGSGDLDLHASKSYIVDLIDRALSRELGTVPQEKKASEPAVNPSQSQKEICVEIARALQGDNCLTLAQNGNVHKEAPEYVRHLKVLRWDYLNHIQEELKKLQDLERILDAYSPRQPSSTVPVRQFQPSTSEQKKNHQSIS